MNTSRRIILTCSAALAVTLGISACGFTPLYGKNAQDYAAGSHSVQEYLAQTSIDLIPDREGVFLRNALIDRFYRHGYPTNPVYRLNVASLRENQVDLDITKNANATRAQLKLNTEMLLFARGQKKPVLRHKIQSVTSFNVLNSEFATRVSEQAARENALNDIAQQIETKIALYFERAKQPQP